MKIGLTIGKYAPFHKGHEYLIKIALREVDELYVMVYETDVTRFTIEERAKWIEELYPTVNIIYAKNPPGQYGMDEESVRIQTDYIKEKIGELKVTHFYSSEKYGKHVAVALECMDRRVDSLRKVIPIEATKIREDLEENKEYLSGNVYEEIIKNKEKL